MDGFPQNQTRPTNAQTLTTAPRRTGLCPDDSSGGAIDESFSRRLHNASAGNRSPPHDGRRCTGTRFVAIGVDGNNQARQVGPGHRPVDRQVSAGCTRLSCSAWTQERHREVPSLLLHLELVGAAGFEPTTLCPPGRCATRLRYAPTVAALKRRELYHAGKARQRRLGSLSAAGFCRSRSYRSNVIEPAVVSIGHEKTSRTGSIR